MDAASRLRSQAAALGISLCAQVCEKELLFLQELLRWNRRMNLTAIRSLEEGVEKHLLDSLTLIPLLKKDESLLDVGSGGGFPGIPLAVALPELQVTSVDSVAKKIQFQRHAVRLLGIQDRVNALHIRIEELAANAEDKNRFDVVVSRAFASLSTIVDSCAPLTKEGGRLLVMKGAEVEEDLSTSRQRITESGLSLSETRSFRLPESRSARTILVLHKTV